MSIWSVYQSIDFNIYGQKNQNIDLRVWSELKKKKKIGVVPKYASTYLYETGLSNYAPNACSEHLAFLHFWSNQSGSCKILIENPCRKEW